MRKLLLVVLMLFVTSSFAIADVFEGYDYVAEEDPDWNNYGTCTVDIQNDVLQVIPGNRSHIRAITSSALPQHNFEIIVSGTAEWQDDAGHDYGLTHLRYYIAIPQIGMAPVDEDTTLYASDDLNDVAYNYDNHIGKIDINEHFYQEDAVVLFSVKIQKLGNQVFAYKETNPDQWDLINTWTIQSGPSYHNLEFVATDRSGYVETNTGLTIAECVINGDLATPIHYIVGMDDIDGNGFPEVAGSHKNPNGRPAVTIRDSLDGTVTGRVRFHNPAWETKGLTIINADSDADDVIDTQYIAVVCVPINEQIMVVEVRDLNGDLVGGPIHFFNQDFGFRDICAVADNDPSDADGDVTDDIGIIAENGQNQTALLEVRSSSSGDVISQIHYMQ